MISDFGARLWDLRKLIDFQSPSKRPERLHRLKAVKSTRDLSRLKASQQMQAIA